MWSAAALLRLEAKLYVQFTIDKIVACLLVFGLVPEQLNPETARAGHLLNKTLELNSVFVSGLLDGVLSAYIKLKLSYDRAGLDSNITCSDILVRCLLLRADQEHKCVDSEDSAGADHELPVWIRLAASSIAQNLGNAAH